MTYRKIYEAWCEDVAFDAAFRAELKALSDEKEIEDRFYKELSFGTAGMRGVIGAGRNRMNIYNIRKATQGFTNYLKTKSSSPTCVIAYDNRRMSVEYSKQAAMVFAANGIKTYVFDALRSTPELSFAVRYLQATGGVVITASHNPPEYNGYKVYGSDGAQLMPELADQVTQEVNAITDFTKIPLMDFDKAIDSGEIVYIGKAIDKAYLDAVLTEQVNPKAYYAPLKVAYSPLHGTGGYIIKELFKRLGVDDICYEPQQMVPDTEFTTVNKPNPEELQAFDILKNFGKKEDAGLLIATDPDADRVGVMVRDKEGSYQKLNGNQVGALLTHYIFSEKVNLPNNPAMVKTIVTSDLGMKIAQKYGAFVPETLTGFKFIGNKILGFEETGAHNFILGYEESYGYLVGTHARDKDAVVAVMLVVEMAKYYSQQQKNLLQVLDELHAEFGYYHDQMVAKTMSGKAGMEHIQQILAGFRADAKDKFSLKIVAYEDYLMGQKIFMDNDRIEALDFPKSNVLKYYLSDGSWFAVRPSGTEPKIKFYISVVANSKTASNARFNDIKVALDAYIDSVINA